MTKQKVVIKNIIKVTAGGFHSWVNSSVGIIRKPNHKIPQEMLYHFLNGTKPTFWRRVLNYIKKLISKLNKDNG